MKAYRRGRIAFFWGLSLSLLLIVTGCIMVYRVFDRYEETILQNEDHHLFGLARSVDRSVTSYLSQYAASLTYLTGRQGFLEAEDAWFQGDSTQLLARMTDTLVAGDGLTHAALALVEGQLALSTDGRTDYLFPPLAGRKGEVDIRPCINGDGTVYLAFVLEQGNDLAYAILMDLSQFYQRVAGTLSAGTQDHIMLMDAGGQTLLHMVAGQTMVELAQEAVGQGCDYPGLPFLIETQHQGAEAATFYDTHSCLDVTPYTARMAVLPATAENNGFFAIGVSMNFDEVIRPLRTGGVRLLAYGGMVVAGILWLVLLALRADWSMDRTQRELAILQEKKSAAEELSRKTQELAHHQRLELLGTLTSSIAHEFNNLLTPIMGYSLMALEKLPPEEEELYDNLLEIYNASREAKTIISRLSDLSRKHTPFTFQQVSLDELARKSLSVAAPARPTGVETVTLLSCGHFRVAGNETQLSQLLLNLILNAFFAMEDEGGTLTLSTQRHGDTLLLRVTDTGRGIPPDVLPHVFEPFYTTKESGRGTGLGLPIVQQVAEDHRGTVSIDSLPGRGTTVTLTLPLSPQEVE